MAILEHMSNDNTAPVTDLRFFTALEPTDQGKPRKLTFTISSPTKHFTFRLKAVKGQYGGGKTLFLSVLTGPDNESSYSYVGILSQKGRIITTRNSKVGIDAQSVRSLVWMWNHIEDLPAGYEIRHSGKCCRCGRKLTTPESIEAGIGPVCATAAGW